MSQHADEATIGQLVAGELEAEQVDRLLEHLSDCEECLQLAEAAWNGISGLAETLEVPEMNRDNRAQIEHRLFRRMHVADLGTQVSWLVTDGFIRVVLILLRPVFQGRYTTTQEVEGE